MRNKTELIELNIHNLTTLWKEASLYNDSYRETHFYNYSAIKGRNFPSRLWFNQKLDQNVLSLAKEEVLADFPTLMIPTIQGEVPSQLLEQNGFEVFFEQVGMSLKLNDLYEIGNDVLVQRVSSADDSELWSKLFQASFGYEIHPEILIHTHEKINYYIVKHHGEPVGTAITYQTDKVMGIHALGIIPEARKQGIAKKMTKVLINNAIKNSCEYCTLQASAMGKGIYVSLGFEEQFVLKNYILKQL